MLSITVVMEPEQWDSETQEFIPPVTTTLNLEHSLVSISKWESKWCKAFLSKRDKTSEEIIDYIKCMTIERDVNPEIFDNLSNDNIIQVKEYIDAPMTATKFYDKGKSGGSTNNDVITSELIYYWMVSQNIPFECQEWHLNRLITLIRVCNMKNSSPNKKMSKSEIMARNRALNDARRKQYNSKG